MLAVLVRDREDLRVLLGTLARTPARANEAPFLLLLDPALIPKPSTGTG